MMLTSARKPVAHTTYGETQLCVRACVSPIMKPMSLYGRTQELMKATHRQM